MEAQCPLPGDPIPAEHKTKCWPEFFRAIWRRQKRFELRRNDRNYKVGDWLLIEEFEPSSINGGYTGKCVRCHIMYMLGDKNDCESFGLMPGFVILGLDGFFRKIDNEDR